MILVNKFALFTSLQTVKHAMGKQDVRDYLNGVQLLMKKDLLRVTASDGHRIAQCELTGCAGKDFNIILYNSSLPLVLASLKSTAGPETVKLDVKARTIGGVPFDVVDASHFPDVEQMFLKFERDTDDVEVLLNGGYLVDAVRALAALNKGKVFSQRHSTSGTILTGRHNIDGLGRVRCVIGGMK